MADQAEHIREDFWADAGFVGRNLARVRGGCGDRGRDRSRYGSGQRGNGISRAESRKEKAGYSDRGQGQVQRARTRGGRGYKCGRRTVRRRLKTQNKVVRRDGGFRGIVSVQQNIGRESPKSSGGDEWDADRARRMYGDEGDEYDDRGQDYADAYSGKAKELMDDSEEDDDRDGDRDEDEDEGDEEGEDGGNGDGFAVMDDGDEGEGEGEGHGDEDDGTASLSSDYSD
ncbi:hypothetical protein ACLOJK_009802 [Asimina triloba]